MLSSTAFGLPGRFTITKRAMLIRGASAIRGQSLIVNLPGSPKAVEESLTYILDSLEHGMDILLGSCLLYTSRCV